MEPQPKTSRMTERRPVLSIITVTWNHRAELGPWLKAMRRCLAESPFAVECIVVDNDSADGTAEFVEEALPGARVIRSGRNAGFAVGCNIGMEAARGRYLLLLNPDAFADAKVFSRMVSFLRRNPRVGALGCTLLHGDGRPQISAYADLSPLSYLVNQSMFYPIVEAVRKRVLDRMSVPRRPRRVAWLMGACIMVPRGVYRQVGGFDPGYFMYSEDADWCRRIRDAGHAVVFHPGLSIHHGQKGSARRAPEWCFRRLYRSVLVYTHKHLTPGERRTLRLTMLGDMVLRLPAYWLVGLVKPDRRGAMAERRASVRRMIRLILVDDPDLFVDPPPSRSKPA